MRVAGALALDSLLLRQDGWALEFAAESLRTDHDFILAHSSHFTDGILFDAVFGLESVIPSIEAADVLARSIIHTAHDSNRLLRNELSAKCSKNLI